MELRALATHLEPRHRHRGPRSDRSHEPDNATNGPDNAPKPAAPLPSISVLHS